MLIVLACAPTRDVLRGQRPSRVVVLASSKSRQPSASGLWEDVFGGDTPEALLSREAIRALEARGYGVSGVERVSRPPGTGELETLVRASGGEAAFLVHVGRLDLSALRTTGEAGVDLELTLVSPNGLPLWESAFRGTTHVRLYRADTDWRAHLRQAFAQAIRSMP